MTDEQKVVAEINAHIATLSLEDQIQVQAWARNFRMQTSDPLIRIAFALVGAELAAQA